MSAEPIEINTGETQVPAYTLPDPLEMQSGAPVQDAEQWRDARRDEILDLFRSHVYGRNPENSGAIRFDVRSLDRSALDGRATRKEVTVHFAEDREYPSMEILIYVPNASERAAPAFLGLNFHGNHTVHTDPAIALPRGWVRRVEGSAAQGNRATEEGRGTSAERWQVERVIEAGYALATIYCGDLVPDHSGGLEASSAITAHVRDQEGRSERKPDAWGAIGAWAWGLSRALDYLESDPDIDASRVAVIGHSRLGKTALWAGAQDERFAVVISNNSGCGGAALSRRRFGETVARINTTFPHWFCTNFREYNNNEDALPVDQHMLIAAVAPRPVYVASASEDLWADPRGEFLAARAAEPVYRLFGKEGLGVDEMPDADTPVGDTIGYHLRTGPHGITAYDWEQYIGFADRHLRRGK